MDRLIEEAMDFLKSIFDDDAKVPVDFRNVDNHRISILNHEFRLLINESPTIGFIDSIKSNLTDISHILLLTGKLPDKVYDELKTNKISFISCADKRMSVYPGGKWGLCLTAGPDRDDKESGNRHGYSDDSANLMSSATLRVILIILSDAEAVRWPLRKIAERSGVSLGSAQRSIRLLTDAGLIFLTPSGRFIKDKEKLLDMWTKGYRMVIQPKAKTGTASFRNPPALTELPEWLPESGYEWGGEAAAYILDRYLQPEIYAVFSENPFRETCMDCRLFPNIKGNVTVYRKFWTGDLSPEPSVAPLPVIYAELMSSHDTRCHDAAKRLLANQSKV